MRYSLRLFIAALVFAIIPFIWNSQNTYMETKVIPVEVVELISGQSTGKYSKLEFIAVYKDEQGRVFDRRVSPSFYTLLNKGDTIAIEIREMDIKQTTKDNLIWFFGTVLLVSICITGFITCIVFGVAYLIDERKNNV
ncbi:thioredoxin [Escherichia phage vB_EcoM-ZQ3]|uniref:Thioredoxin n=1 Tax=Escherichia phage vB_EcoM-ZQ3 TaxID=2810369 RepID=A0A8F3HL11_9CAUD|nr:thioredoxin [Escherichia phage vB_EcoM-ZQ3]